MTINSILFCFYALVTLVRLTNSADISYNQPKLSPCAEWDPNGITVINKPDKNFEPINLFVDKNNTVYATSYYSNAIYKWRNGSANITRLIYDNWTNLTDIFISTIGDIYFSDANGTVYKRTSITNISETVADFGVTCDHIFIDINDVLYCSASAIDVVVTKSLRDNARTISIVAGVGISGSGAHRLLGPQGIFVSINLDLYVADSGNHRIQLFRSGEISGTTVAGAPYTKDLNYPTGVILDTDDRIYILNRQNSGIVVVVSGLKDFKCLAGCTQSPGSSSYRLSTPLSMAFDSYGNIYVADTKNKRIQKFLLSTNTCNTTTGATITTTPRSTIITSTTAADASTLIQSVYTSILTSENPTYSERRTTHYYEIIQLHVFKEGQYIFFINSTDAVSTKLYKNHFNPFVTSGNLLLQFSVNCYINHIKFTTNFWFNETYILVVATTKPNMISFSVITAGPSKISFSSADPPKSVQSTYASALTANSHKCARNPCRVLKYYCEAVKINTTDAGNYMITSISAMDTYGYIYDKRFNVLDLMLHSIDEDDDGGDYLQQFRLRTYREMNTSFILVITTKEPNKQGNFSIIIRGPNNVSMKHIDTIPPIIQSIYSFELNNNSSKSNLIRCDSPDYYYEAFKINAATSGYYIFSTNSSMYPIGILYDNSFNPYDPQQNVLFTGSDDYNCVFLETTYLQSSTTYTLVVSTHYPNTLGVFSVTVHGPANISMSRIGGIPTVTYSVYSSSLTENNPQHAREECPFKDFYYEAIQIKVATSDNYIFSGKTDGNLDALLYENYFDPYNLNKEMALMPIECDFQEYGSTTYLKSNITYVLVMTTHRAKTTANFLILASGPGYVTFDRISLQSNYTSELTIDNQVYPRECGENYHYETIQVNVQQTDFYTFESNSGIELYGSIYENDFDPSDPDQNLVIKSNSTCPTYHFGLHYQLQVDRTYILVITTLLPKVTGPFTLLVRSTSNVTLNHITKHYSSCVVGDRCSPRKKSIGLTLNDILRNQILPNVPLARQSSLIQVGACVTMIMFVAGIVNGIFSLVTFRDKELRKVGCGIYLLASSITSLLTITIFTVKFWFVVLIQIHSIVSSAILQVDCAFIGSFLKLCLYVDGWLNACVAIERTVSVSKGINFDKKMSRRIARWTITILPILIMGTIIHEPIHQELFSYIIQKYKPIYNNSTMNMSMENDSNEHKKPVNVTYDYVQEQHRWCTFKYSPSLQTYNTITLFVHLIIPFVINLGSALYIIFGTARQRSAAQNTQSYREHVLKQLSEHKQLVISPMILFVLALPRLIIPLASECVDPSSNPWLYLCGYFIAYIPPMLVFVVFVIPSKLYTKTFKKTIGRFRRQTHQ